jgi:hypothetical protein
MRDDLFNSWGTTLIDPVISSKSGTRGSQPNTVSDNNQNKQILENKVTSLTKHKFTLFRVESCGSTANTLAILESTCGDSQACLFAVGSYIAGDKGYFNSISLNSKQMDRHGPVLPQKSCDATPLQVRTHVALPYYIPSCQDKEVFVAGKFRHDIADNGTECLNYYEDKCLMSLHLVLLHRRIMKKPVRVFFSSQFSPAVVAFSA